MVNRDCALHFQLNDATAVLIKLLRISKGQQDVSESETCTVSLGSFDDDQVADNCVGDCAHAHKVQHYVTNPSANRVALKQSLGAVENVGLCVHLYVGTQHAGFAHRAVESGYCGSPDKFCLVREPPELDNCWAFAVCCLLVAIKCMRACSVKFDLAQCMTHSY